MSQAGILSDSSSSGADIETITGNSGGAVGPDGAFNIGFTASGGFAVTGNPGANSLNMAPDGWTTGSVVFASAANAFSQDNTNLFWDNTAKRLTIGNGSAEFPSNLLLLATTHATSRRASIVMGDWGIIQDSNGDGTQNLAIRQTSGASTVINITTARNVAIGGFITPVSKLGINGNLAVGATFNSLAAPTSGAIIEGDVGIGSSIAPASTLKCVATGLPKEPLNLESYQLVATINTGVGANIIGRRARNTEASPQAVEAGDVLTGFYGAGHDGTSFNGNTVSIRYIANETFTPTARGTRMDFSTTADGTTSRVVRGGIAASGTWTFGSGATALSTVGIVGNLSVGATYGVLAAPTNGLIVEGQSSFGTTSSGYSARIAGNFRFENTSANAVMEIAAPDANQSNIHLQAGVATKWQILRAGTSFDLQIFNAVTGNIALLGVSSNDNVLLCRSAGNVKIGSTAAPNAMLDVQGSQAFKITVPGAYPYDILTTDYLVTVDTSIARSIVLPTSAAGNSGVNYIVKDVTGSAAANNITVTVNGGGNIDGAASSVLNQNYEARGFYSNGTQWFAI